MPVTSRSLVQPALLQIGSQPFTAQYRAIARGLGTDALRCSAVMGKELRQNQNQ